MLKTILACVDGSQYAEAALSASLWLGKSLDARIQALSVVDIRLLEGPWLSDLSGITGLQPFQGLVTQLRELYKRKAQTAVDEVAAEALKAGVACRKEVRSGLLVDEILEAEKNADLVVLGQRGEGFETTGEWLGSNVERVVRKSVKPCLITPREFRPIKTILTAYDGSEHARHALGVALELAKRLPAKLTILAVETSRDVEKISSSLKEAVERAAQEGLHAASVELQGNPEEIILQVAERETADLIVMGAYGHTRLRELVLGSVTGHVIRKSPVAVLLAR